MNPFFTLQEKLGEGGQGLVHRAHDSRLEREIAVKELHGEAARDRDEVRRFLQEARTTAQLQHPGIPAVYEVGHNEDGTPFMALLLVEGETLASVIKRLQSHEEAAHRDYPFPRRLQLIVRLCETVEYAHHRGWVHRDIKPENIMVGRFGEVYLMDWGLARPHPHPGTANVFTGTPHYASPEALRGEPVTPCSEVYSLGAVLYMLMTLRLPHDAPELDELVRKITKEPPVPPESVFNHIHGRVPREISRTILRALEKEPGRRYAQVSDLRLDLIAFLENHARPVCPHTSMKSFLFQIVRIMDNHPAFSVLVLAWLLLPVALGAFWVGWHYLD